MDEFVQFQEEEEEGRGEEGQLSHHGTSTHANVSICPPPSPP